MASARRTTTRPRAAAVALPLAVATALTGCAGATAAGGSDDGSGEGDSIVVGHLAAHTGPFADVGPLLDGSTAFAIDLINEAPPLDRPLEQINQDLGTIGEAQASRLLVEREDVDVLWGIAHEYMSYRDWILQQVADDGRPLIPSVHGGAVPGEYGGTAQEPMFRGAPMDSGQAIAAVLQAKEAGAATIAIVATEIEGSQAQKEAAERVAEEVGLEVVTSLDVQPEQASYRSTVSSVADADPDALLMFTQAEDGGTIVKQAAEAGLSLVIVGTQEWLGNAFFDVATHSALEQHESVQVAAYTHADSPAWDFFKEQWEASEYAELASPENSYATQFYDLLNVTALAIEAAGEVDAASWADTMREVAMAPGKTVYTYQEGVEALRDGEDIDYSGVTGEYDYSETGIVSGLYGIFEWTADGALEQVSVIDDGDILELEETA
jgi:ABC-type branched-subunit amino acid transport system substrate-binding protein